MLTLRPLAADGFQRHAAEWDQLNRARYRTALLESHFIAPLIDCFGAADLHLLLARDAAGTVAAGLLQHHGPGHWETFQPSQAPLGPWLQTAEAGTELAPRALRQLPGCALLLSLTQQDPRLLARPGAAPSLQVLDYIETAHIDIDCGWDEYWARRGKNLRHGVKKQLKRLEEEGVALRVDCLRGAAEMAQAIREYGALEQAGWKADGGTAVGADNLQGKFYRLMLENFARQGRARVYRLSYGGRPVALDLCIIGEDEALVVLKTTYDESIRASSPAMLLKYFYFAELFRAGQLRRIEFYGKVMDWHGKWTAATRTLYHVNQYRWGFLGALSARRRGRRAAAPGEAH